MSDDRRETPLLSELNLLESGLDQVQEDIEHLHRLASVGTLAAGVMHEVRNLLTPALAYSDLLQQNASPDQRQVLEKISHGIRQAAAVSNSMLDLAAAATPDVATSDVLQSVRGVIGGLGPKSHQNVSIETSILPGMMVCVAPRELHQVLLNLVLNALRALGGRPGVISLGADRKGAFTQITVCDNGPGIPAGIRDCLFEPFVTAPVTQKDDNRGKPSMPTPDEHRQPAGGTGLGLSICRQIVQRSKGTISVDSSTRQGTSFVITLPTHSRKAA